MKRFLSAICAGAVGLAVAFTSIVPVNAAPLLAPRIETDSNVTQIQHREWRHGSRHSSRRDWGGRRDWRGGRDWGGGRGWHHGRPGWGRPGWGRPGYSGWGRPGWRHGYRPGYWGGYRGYRYYRPGYRRYNDGWWYPLAAFGLGAAIIANQPTRVVPAYGSAHVQWCASRYRSYRAYDNTYQPYNGPRRQCYSPYS
ncbi:BA14K family protein [Phyllobacterium leguminum]|nr:BA14K family protein [Phyllobacterium leguminum]